MYSIFLFLFCAFLVVSGRPFEELKERERFEAKEREREEAWRPFFGTFEDRSKLIKNKERYEDRFLIESGRPYFPGLYTFPFFFWEYLYQRPTFSYPEVNYYVKKDVKEKPIFKA